MPVSVSYQIDRRCASDQRPYAFAMAFSITLTSLSGRLSSLVMMATMRSQVSRPRISITSLTASKRPIGRSRTLYDATGKEYAVGRCEALQNARGSERFPELLVDRNRRRVPDSEHLEVDRVEPVEHPQGVSRDPADLRVTWMELGEEVGVPRQRVRA